LSSTISFDFLTLGIWFNLKAFAMRFRKYSRKHAFNIVYQWDLTGEPLERVAQNYWLTLEAAYKYVEKLSKELLEKLDNIDFDIEVYAKKFETLSEEEILADKLRKTLFKIYLLLKSLGEFHNLTLTLTEWLSERNKKRREKALKILSEIKYIYKSLLREDKELREYIDDILNFLNALEEKTDLDFETVKRIEKQFKQKVFELLKIYLKEVIEFSQKRLSEDMGEIKEYAYKLLKAFKEHRIEIDSLIEEFLKGWTLDRLGSVERNLLRLGVAEFAYVGVSDPGRAFNDYIDFAKALVDKKAAKFVNGVLSAIYNKKLKKEQNSQ